MDLWHGHISEFVELAGSPSFSNEMARQFSLYHREDPSPAEVNSWTESLGVLAESAKALANDEIGVLVEYHLPLSARRIDAMFFGKHADRDHSVLVELKQWDACGFVDEYCENLLVGVAEHVHPSQQALDYAGYLEDVHSDYSNGEVTVQPCSFCHDAGPAAEQVLRDGRFTRLLDKSPMFTAAQARDLGRFVKAQVGDGNGMSILRRVRTGRFRPGPRVIETLKAVLEHERSWHLLNEQRQAYNRIVAEVRKRQRTKGRTAILVRGGPGTGKTVIAMQTMAQMLGEGFSAAHSTGGKAFTTALQANFRRSQALFRWNHQFRKAEPMEIDLLLADEAHRIRESSNTRWTKKAERSDRSQVDELLDAAKVTVFFLDENQFIRPGEIGRSALIRHATSTRSIPLIEYDLDVQFRCGGSIEYLQWVDYLLGFRADPPERWDGRYSIGLAVGVDELEGLLTTATDAGESARLVAGFSWKWSDPIDDLTLVNDVVIGDWSRPWNRKASETKSYRPENHPYTLWATGPEGLGQVGCVYSSQGFEFDRVGVIWGEDLVWRGDKWVAAKGATKDPGLKGTSDDERARLIRNAYRVLMTRGMKQTTVLCLDQETREHVTTVMSRTAVSV